MRHNSRFFLLACVATGVLTLASESFAQIVPPSVDPGNVGRRQQKLKTPDVTPEPLIEEEDSSRKRDITGESVTFELKSVAIEGAEEYKHIGLEDIYGEYIGQKVSLRTLHGVADRITTKLRNDGYALSRAVVPAQRVNNGRVIIRILGGNVSNVVVEGTIEGRDDLIQAYADKIRAQNPLNFKKLERYLLLMEDLPGVTAKGYLRPGRTTGSSELVIRIDHDMLEGNVGVDNRGNKFLGPIQGNALVKLNSALGLYEQTALRTNISSQTEELKFFELVHEEQLGYEGTKLVLTASHTKTHPGSTLDPLDIDGESNEYGVALRHPFIRSRSENLLGSLGFIYRESQSDSPLVPSYEDNVRKLDAGLAYDFVGLFEGINRVEGGIGQGLNVMDANNAVTSRANADETFTKFTANVSHLRTLYGPLSLQLGVNGQYSNDPLFASEEFGVGGAAYGGAYDAFEISGDSGVAFRGELQVNDVYPVDILDAYQLYGFYDAGKVWNEKVIAGETKDAGLTSAGFGVRFNLDDQPVYGGVEVAFPLSRDVQSEGDDDPRVFFNVSYQF